MRKYCLWRYLNCLNWQAGILSSIKLIMGSSWVQLLSMTQFLYFLQVDSGIFVWFLRLLMRWALVLISSSRQLYLAMRDMIPFVQQPMPMMMSMVAWLTSSIQGGLRGVATPYPHLWAVCMNRNSEYQNQTYHSKSRYRSTSWMEGEAISQQKPLQRSYPCRSIMYKSSSTYEHDMKKDQQATKKVYLTNRKRAIRTLLETSLQEIWRLISLMLTILRQKMDLRKMRFLEVSTSMQMMAIPSRSASRKWVMQNLSVSEWERILRPLISTLTLGLTTSISAASRTAMMVLKRSVQMGLTSKSQAKVMIMMTNIFQTNRMETTTKTSRFQISRGTDYSLMVLNLRSRKELMQLMVLSQRERRMISCMSLEQLYIWLQKRWFWVWWWQRSWTFMDSSDILANWGESLKKKDTPRGRLVSFCIDYYYYGQRLVSIIINHFLFRMIPLRSKSIQSNFQLPLRRTISVDIMSWNQSQSYCTLTFQGLYIFVFCMLYRLMQMFESTFTMNYKIYLSLMFFTFQLADLVLFHTMYLFLPIFSSFYQGFQLQGLLGLNDPPKYTLGTTETQKLSLRNTVQGRTQFLRGRSFLLGQFIFIFRPWVLAQFIFLVIQADSSGMAVCLMQRGF